MGLWDYVILILIAGAVIGALVGTLRRKKTGCCCGDCAKCSQCSHK